MIRAVIDTNVLVSGMLSPAGNEALVLLAVHQGLLHPCLSPEILVEYEGVLARPKFDFAQEEIAALLAMLRLRGELVESEGVPFASPDPSDTKFLNCAHATQADYLVTGNKRDFPDSPYGPTRIVSASELLERITLEM